MKQLMIGGALAVVSLSCAFSAQAGDALRGAAKGAVIGGIAGDAGAGAAAGAIGGALVGDQVHTPGEGTTAGQDAVRGAAKGAIIGGAAGDAGAVRRPAPSAVPRLEASGDTTDLAAERAPRVGRVSDRATRPSNGVRP